MIRIKNYIAHSPINGFGLFAKEAVKKGDLVWSFEEGLDRRFTEEEFSALAIDVQDFLENYAYRSVLDNLIYCPFDNDRYMNHSRQANTCFGGDGNFYAARDIAKDEEITCDYSEFNANWERYRHIYEGEEKNARSG